MWRRMERGPVIYLLYGRVVNASARPAILDLDMRQRGRLTFLFGTCETHFSCD
jgi:hypothetical protein